MTEERAGARGTVVDGVFFTESSIDSARRLGSVSIEISRQNSNLVEVKRQLAAKVKQKGGNALIEFKYGQRAHAWWEMIMLKWDTESWHGAGEAVALVAANETTRAR